MAEHEPAGMVAAEPPRLWLLVDDRPGHRTQVVGLARRLGWPAVEKRLAFNALNRLPNPLLGAALVSLRRAGSDVLAPPWPDLVLGVGRRVVPVARWIRRQSGGRAKVVLLGRKAASRAAAADLEVSCAHFGVLAHPRLVELTLPPTQVDRAALAAARAARPDPLADLPRPRVLLLVGGPTAQHAFDAGFAGRMAAEVAAAAAAEGGGLAIVTSRRTPAAAVAAMQAAAPSAHLHAWVPNRQDNPYLGYLAAADLLAVTGESESMLAEAVATGRPLTIYPLPPKRPGPRAGMLGWLRGQADGGSLWAALARALFAGGWATPPRDLDALHRRLEAEGLGKRFDGRINLGRAEARDEVAAVAERMRALVEGGPGGAA